MDLLVDKSYDKVYGSMDRRGINSASINEIIVHTVDSSKRQNIPFIWLLQYSADLNKNDLNERNYIINRLLSKNITFIDTFYVVHKSKKYSSDQLWFGHHTPLGNRVVCEEIAKYLQTPLNNFQ